MKILSSWCVCVSAFEGLYEARRLFERSMAIGNADATYRLAGMTEVCVCVCGCLCVCVCVCESEKEGHLCM